MSKKLHPILNSGSTARSVLEETFNELFRLFHYAETDELASIDHDSYDRLQGLVQKYTVDE